MQGNISKLTCLVIGLVFSLASAGAFAQGPMSGPGGPMMKGFDGGGAVRCERMPMMRGHEGQWGHGPGMAMRMREHHRGMQGMMLGPRIMRALKITDQQRDQIGEVVHKARMENWKIKGEIMDAQYRMHKLYRVDQPDPRKVADEFMTISKYKSQMLENRVRAHNEIWNLLTKEQQQQVKNWKHGHWKMMTHKAHAAKAMP